MIGPRARMTGHIHNSAAGFTPRPLFQRPGGYRLARNLERIFIAQNAAIIPKRFGAIL